MWMLNSNKKYIPHLLEHRPQLKRVRKRGFVCLDALYHRLFANACEKWIRTEKLREAYIPGASQRNSQSIKKFPQSILNHNSTGTTEKLQSVSAKDNPRAIQQCFSERGVLAAQNSP